MRGFNPRGDKFVAQEVFCDGSLPLPDHNADKTNALEGRCYERSGLNKS